MKLFNADFSPQITEHIDWCRPVIKYHLKEVWGTIKTIQEDVKISQIKNC
jgi:hypothetical protein